MDLLVRAFLFSIVLVAPLSGCASGPRAVAPPAGWTDEGAVFVYLAPLTDRDDRDALRVDGVVALREDGGGAPLAVRLDHIEHEAHSQQRLLAWGAAPPGRYTGLAISLRGAGTDEAAPAGAPVRVEIGFEVSRERASVLMVRRLSADPGDPALAGPTFSATTPPKLAPALLGLVTSRAADTVTVFDKATGQVGGVILTGRGPAGIALDEHRLRAYIALSGEDALSVVDLLENRQLERLKLNGGDAPTEVALTLDRSRLLVTNAGSNSVSVVDTRSLYEVARVAVGVEPRSITLDPAGRRAYVFNSGSDSLSVIDVGSASLIGSVAVDTEPLRGQFNRRGDRLYVIHASSPYVAVIDPATLSVIRRIHVGPGASAIKVDPRTDRILLARRGGPGVEIFDSSSLLPVDSIPAPGVIDFMALDGEGRNLCLVMADAQQVLIVGLVSKKFIGAIDVGADPFWTVFPGEL